MILLRNSVPAELALLAVVHGAGVLFVWRPTVALDLSSWYGAGINGKLQPSLADLGNSFAVVKEMRLNPFTLQTVLQLAVTTLLPVTPLLLTIFPLEEQLDRLLKLLF